MRESVEYKIIKISFSNSLSFRITTIVSYYLTHILPNTKIDPTSAFLVSNILKSNSRTILFSTTREIIKKLSGKNLEMAKKEDKHRKVPLVSMTTFTRRSGVVLTPIVVAPTPEYPHTVSAMSTKEMELVWPIVDPV